ncbi:MAG TPA: elongation factor 4 [Planctomycetaceae bacterium]|jgi:GTP-binding protein LepA|nr:elongation factor 4 [Rhodopirellula sp.]MCH2359568.1 translation elongation factor 4 [Pirellulales bacterium]HAL12606.1 elongation factor 4 [Planctomycetaceae bacterium]HCK71806.1 elongation factor 4 [Planctomycetaceae bacterium]HCP83738.1 elongation factor 4 [Planctomycetaceae bacterium]|tara:strand:- start:3210 stop:5012 length:1803 start_codon:yes stop_codon:yes gene_type:complete
MNLKNIRNFCIIAHIDHGKSTLADRLLEYTGTVTKREMKEQLLDDMELERERGITIKARTVSMQYTHGNESYELNLIDTPGHVDFQYEVSRSLACCEGALLLVDAFQGIEAQTVANAYNAMDQELHIIPVINKIDLTHARVDEIIEEIEQTLMMGEDEIQKVSAKAGLGIDELLDAVIGTIPPPEGGVDEPLQAMVFDSHYDEYRGVITYVRVMNGTIKKGQKIRFLGTESNHEVLELGQFAPQQRPCEELHAGQVGYLICNIKSLELVNIGDTVSTANASAEPLEGYQPPKRMVYCGLYPSDGQDFKELRDALERLAINDPSFEFEPETSDALGFGFRCGFLGLLHMEIVQQRLEQESDIDLVQTAPNVTYELTLRNGETKVIHRPQEVPDSGDIEEFRQPIVKVNFVVPADYIGAVMKLCQDRRGVQKATEYLSPTRTMITYELPLAEVIYDLHDKLKSATRGYGTMDYEVIGYFPADLVRMDILVNGNKVDALSVICDRNDADRRGRAVCKKLKEEIDRHMFEVAVQAAIGARVIARETVRALRKNVTAKCYGGDISRKRKLWAKQREGKKRMKSIGSVDIPQKAFMAVLDTGAEKR